jgi:DNA primase
LAPGSQKDRGCFSIPAQPRPSLILCESAIDAISCFVLYPTYRCLSTAGARPNPHWLPLLLEQGCQIYCGFDADPTGDAMAAALITRHPAVQRLRPAQHDWNDVLKSHA